MSTLLQFFLPSIASILLLALTSLPLLPPTTSTSMHTLPQDHSITPRITGFQATLKHIDSGENLTKSDLLKCAMKRGRKRVERLHTMALDNGPNIASQIHAAEGEFLMDLAIGTPPLPYSTILESGSDLIWSQCQPCLQCFKQTTPIFDPNDSSSYSSVTCSHSICKDLRRPFCGGDNNDTCMYKLLYGDGSITECVMATETFTFENNDSVPKLGFRCGHTNVVSFDDDGKDGVGVGLSRGKFSLVLQLDEPKFSYCLTSFGLKKNGVLSMGSRATTFHPKGRKVITTPLIPDSIFYYVSLLGITIGETLLPIDKSTFARKDNVTGGVIVDSGTTLTILAASAFREVKKEFTRQVKLPPHNGGELEVCFDLPSKGYELPRIVYHFEGADMELPVENYFVVVDEKSKVGCLAMASSGGHTSIIGNIQQQNMLVVHDLAQESVSFAPAQCDKL